MKNYLNGLVNQLKSYSQSLDKKSLFIDKPWALLDEEHEIQKLIFKKNKELVLSKNGQVTMGKWDYFPEAKSLLIDRKTDTILCNEGYIDESVMIMKLDGTKNEFFVLANQNKLPDLDVLNYLNSLRSIKLKITSIKLKDNRTIEIYQKGNTLVEDRDGISEGDLIYMEGEKIQDGKYHIPSTNKYIIVKGGKIIRKLYSFTYTTKTNVKVEVHQKYTFERNKGEDVFIDGEIAPDGKYKLGFLNSIRVRNGKIA